MTTPPTPSHGYQATPRVSPGQPWTGEDVTTTPTPPTDSLFAKLAHGLLKLLNAAGGAHRDVAQVAQDGVDLEVRADLFATEITRDRVRDLHSEHLGVLVEGVEGLSVHEADAKPNADSPSDDPTETRTARPTLTDHLEDLIRADEILAREFPQTPSRERIRVAIEITGALKWGAL